MKEPCFETFTAYTVVGVSSGVHFFWGGGGPAHLYVCTHSHAVCRKHVYSMILRTHSCIKYTLFFQNNDEDGAMAKYV